MGAEAAIGISLYWSAMVTKREPARKSARRKVRTVARRSFWDDLIEIGYRIPEKELAKHPNDGAENLEHYLYGRPKRT